MTGWLGFEDDLGPKRVIHVHQPSLGLQGALVVDNVAAGPSIGGLRMAEDVTVAECFRLARAMSLKNAAAGLPHGGGKSVLRGDPKQPRENKEELIRAFACALGDVEDYIFGPDMGTDEGAMAWVKDEIGRSVGLPREVGGIPLDELGATGFGLMQAIEAAMPATDFELAGARVVIQGFGAVGMHTARFLAERGAVVIAASDSNGAVLNDGGLDVAALGDAKRQGQAVADFPGGEALDRDAVIDVDCEIWVPAARPDVIDMGNVDRLRTKLVPQGANIPITTEAEQSLHARGILCLPDFIANAGGVICAAMEYAGAGEAAAFAAIAEKIRRNTEEVLQRSRDEGTTPRAAAFRLAEERLRRAMETRRWSIF
ncbi:MAG: Glu/Leu/Phe/Val dehydrogenase [Alphaproteobacteria bacterium]|nr:Glu/Leu/Phe/Val dehydrogenase [Alphaproteobacteria bacterium]MDP6814323.1 Glu/Leu/Phe/Val dehydrogenase [Alphaproteobacteria bacterium]